MDQRPELLGSTSTQSQYDPAALTRPFDAIVIGSGPGGATVARELARRGGKVLILDRGDKAPVTGSMTQTLRELWMSTRSLFLTDRLLAVVRGVTVGGSSIYFFGTAWEPPYELFLKHGIDLRPPVAEAKRELPIAPLPADLMGPAARRVMESATEGGTTGSHCPSTSTRTGSVARRWAPTAPPSTRPSGTRACSLTRPSRWAPTW